MRIRMLVATTLLAAAASLPAVAQQLRPGLWEVHTRMDNPELNEALAQMQQQMAAMPPEQRKQMEAMMAQQGVRMAPGAGAAGGMTVQVCMTREQVERNDIPMQEGCRVTRQQRSGNTLNMAFSCSNPPSSGEGQFTFQGPQAYTSRMAVSSAVDGRTETTRMETRGKWLQADCGSVKPVLPRK